MAPSVIISSIALQSKRPIVKTSCRPNVPKVMMSPVKTSLNGQNVPSQIVPGFDCGPLHDVLIHVLQLAACKNN